MKHSSRISMKIIINQHQPIHAVVNALLNLGYKKVMWQRDWERARHMEIITYPQNRWFSNFNRDVPKSETCRLITLDELIEFNKAAQLDLFGEEA